MVVAKALRDDMIAFLSQTLVSVDRAADPSQRTGERRETLHRVSFMNKWEQVLLWLPERGRDG
jgi:hypothetical protein